MSDRPRASVEIRDFPGLIGNLDPSDLPEGAALVQVNVVSIVPGELQTRLGYKTVSFDN